MDNYIRAASVVSITDGDTLKVDADLGWRVTLRVTVRVHGINAPEHGTPIGDAATALVRSLLPVGTATTLTSYGPDKYGDRWQGAITLPDGRDLAAVLVAAGLAFPWGGNGPKPTQ